MKNTALHRSIPFWLLLVLSLAGIGAGAWIATDQINVMTAALLGGTATGVEVYAGQSWVVVGGALLAGGVIGLFLALAIAAAKSLMPKPTVDIVETIDWSTDAGESAPTVAANTGATDLESAVVETPESTTADESARAGR